MSGYIVGETEYATWGEAKAVAVETRQEIFADGRRVWSPAPPVTTKKLREYYGRMNAYKASRGIEQVKTFDNVKRKR